MIKKLFFKYFELTFWIAALIALAICDPAQPSHFTLCPFKLLGITWCPGCGIGHAIAFLFNGDVARSFDAHWFGIPGFRHNIVADNCTKSQYHPAAQTGFSMTIANKRLNSFCYLCRHGYTHLFAV